MALDGSDRITKRTFIRLVGATVGAATLAAGATTTGATDQPSGFVDLGSEGLQPGDDLAPWLVQYWQAGYEVHIPGGEYTLSDPDALGIYGDDHAWLVGDGDVIADHGDQQVLFNIDAFGDAHVRIQNITMRGLDTGPDSKIRTIAWDAESLIELVNVNRPDGAVNGQSATGFFVPQEHAGTVRFVNCHVENFSDNGLYASAPATANNGQNGLVEVYGGLYRNNDVSGIRLGSDNCLVQSVAVVNDATAPTSDADPGIQRGIRIRHDGENIRVDDLDLYHLDVPGVGGPFEVEDGHPDFGPGGSTSVTNTRIRNDTAVNAINTETETYDITGDTIELTGSGSLELDGTYTNVVRGADATPPTTEKRYYEWEDGVARARVSTGTAGAIDDTSATLTGTLGDLGDAASADVFFEYRKSFETTWVATPKQTFSEPTGYSADVTGLEPGTEYTFRAAAVDSNGFQTTGGGAQFTTTGSGSPPTIDTFTVTEAGDPNPHVDITVEWSVSDPNGDLAEVVVGLLDADGNLLDAIPTDVSGSSASGTDEFFVKKGEGQRYTVSLTVTDQQGQRTIQTTELDTTGGGDGGDGGSGNNGKGNGKGPKK